MLLLAAAALLCSCSDKSGVPPPEENEDGITLTVWTWRRSYNGKALEIAGDYYSRENPGVTIDIKNVSRDEILSRLNVKFTIRDYEGLPDIVLVEDYQIQEYLRFFPGEIRDLSDALNAGHFADFASKAKSYDGKIYGVPFDTGAAVMFYRVDYIEQAGYTREDMTGLTWDKYIQIGNAVREKTGKYMLTLNPTDLWQVRLMLQSAGQWYVKDDGKTANLANNPVLKDAIKTYIDIVKSGISLQVPGYDLEYSSVGSGDVATVLTGTWRLQQLINSVPEQEGKWAVTTIPRMESHNSVNASALGGYGWYVVDKAGNADAASDFLVKTLGSDMDLLNELANEIYFVAAHKNAGDLPNYTMPVDIFGGDPVLKQLYDMIEGVPAVDYGMYTYAIDRIIEDSVQLIMQGADMDDTLQTAQIMAEAVSGSN